MLVAGDCPECDSGLINLGGGDGQYLNDCPECGHSWAEYKCRFCGAEHDGEDQYNCPECGPNGSRIWK